MSERFVVLWLPREDEHALAASLGMCEKDPKLLRELVESAQQQIARDMPGAVVRIHRWHIWRVVRAMHTVRVLNTPDGRAKAYAYLSRQPEV